MVDAQKRFRCPDCGRPHRFTGDALFCCSTRNIEWLCVGCEILHVTQEGAEECCAIGG